MSIKNILLEEQPREKAIQLGIEHLSNQELIAILIRSGNKSKSAIDLAKEILTSVNGIANLYDLTMDDLMAIPGIKEAKATSIMAALELNKRIRLSTMNATVLIKDAKDAYEYMKLKLAYEKQEKVVALFLNARNEVIKEKTLFIGSLNVSIISPREIFKEALLCSSVSMILFHNHPSGNCEPSDEDISVTKKIKVASIYFEINFIDHIIIGKNNYLSMANEKII